MAKARPILAELSGSIGDVVWSHNKGGAYARRRAVPTNPNSTQQQQARAFLAQVSRAWAGLTTGQKTSWADFAVAHPDTDPLGNQVLLSGHQSFVQHNTRVLALGQAVLPFAPTTAGPASLLTFSPAFASPSSITVAFTPTPLAAGQVLQVWIALPGGQGRNPNFAQARLVAQSAIGDASGVVLASRIPAQPGNLVHLWGLIVDVTGQASPPLRNRVNAT